MQRYTLYIFQFFFFKYLLNSTILNNFFIDKLNFNKYKFVNI
jgi:hypothetical protein